MRQSKLRKIMTIENKNSILSIIFLTSFCLIQLFFVACKEDCESGASQFLREIRDSLDLSEPIQKRLSERIDSLLASPNPEGRLYDAVHGYCSTLHHQGKQSVAIDMYSKIVKYYESIDSPSSDEVEKLIDLYIALGAAVEELGMKNMAMDYYMRGMDVADKYGMERQKAMLLNNIGVIYFGVADYERAKQYFEDAGKINLKYVDTQVANRELFINYNNIAEVYLKNNDFENAMDYSLKALQYLNEDADASLYYLMHANIGMIYSHRNNYPLAVSYISNAAYHQKKHGFNSDLVESYIILSEIHEKFNALDSADFYSDKALMLSKEISNVALESKAMGRKSGIAKAKGNFKLSVDLLEQATSLNDSVRTMDNRKKMEDWEKVYESERKAQQEASLISQWNPENIFYGMSGIVAILLCIIIIVYQAKRSKDKALEVKTRDEHEKERIRQEKLLEEQNERNRLQEAVDQRNRELTTYTLERLKTNECITDITQELRQLLLEINPRSKEHKEHIQKILKKLLLLEQRNDWEEFQYYFEKVHPSFYSKLEAYCPSLTPKEKRLCAFIVLGLQTKEIAAITFREVRSIESSRNRLRKKLNVSPETNLTDYIRTLTIGQSRSDE